MQKAIIVTAPSGAGKTTLVRHLLDTDDRLAFSVSATTRRPRAHEEAGRDYHFLSTEGFREAVDTGRFLEWEEVYEGLCYGTLRSEVERLWADGKAVIFDIDVKGAVNLKEAFGDQALSVYIMPPSVDELKRRLAARGTESTESIERRADRYAEELAYADRFDRTLVNDDLETARAELAEMVGAFLEEN